MTDGIKIFSIILCTAAIAACAPQPLATQIAHPEQQVVMLDVEGDEQRVLIEKRGPELALIIHNLADGDVHDVLVTPSLAVGLLADRRLANLWPALERWGGLGLNIQRDRTISELPVGDLEQYAAGLFEAEHGSRKLLEQIYTLRTLGRFTDAHRLLDAYQETDPSAVEQTATFAIARSDLLKSAGRKAEAMATLTNFLEPGRSTEATAQALSNLSELKVEEGLTMAGLATMDRRDQLLGYAADTSMPMTMDWVRACAMSQLSQEPAGKAAVVASMRTAWRRAIEEDALPLAGDGRSNVAPEYLRFAFCTGDGGALADVLAYDFEMGRVPLAAAWLFQPGYKPLDPDHAEAIAAARHDARMAPLLTLVRPLNREYDQAVNNWRLQ